MALIAKFCGHEFRLEPSEYAIYWRPEDGFEWRGEFHFPEPIRETSNIVVVRDELFIFGGRYDYVVTYTGEPAMFEFRAEPRGYVADRVGTQ